ncbi:hypothetical protein RSAG8_07268, partial [Rhizoctonia solani AG-8 WAC10335]
MYFLTNSARIHDYKRATCRRCIEIIKSDHESRNNRKATNVGGAIGNLNEINRVKGG